MKIEETEHSELKIKKTKQSIDKSLGVPPPFIDKCAVYVISGSMGSGKSTFTNSLMTAGGKDKVFKRVFEEVYYSTPQEVYESETDHPFKDHSKDRTYFDLSVPMLEEIAEKAIAVKEEDGESCLILDDWSEELKDKKIEKALKKLIFKHRHYRLNIIITLLTLKALPKQLRSLIDCYITFRPKSIIEIQSFAEDVFSLDRKDLKTLMDYTFDEKYNFLFYNQRDNTYYKNFNKLKFIDED